MTMDDNIDSLLDIKGVEKDFGGVKAIENLSFMVKPGSIKGFIGPNGVFRERKLPA